MKVKKENIKELIKYIIIFFSIIILCVSLLVVTAKIPKESIEKNIEESTPYLSKNSEINYIKRKHPFMWLHIYADEMLLNITYNIDTDKTLESVLEAKYFDNGLASLRKQMEDKSQVANTEYIRYWHGSMIFIRPMLTIFNIHQIYIVNAIIMAMLTIALLVILFKKKQKLLAFLFIIAFIMTGSIFVPFCLEYTWVYMIMLLTSIIAVLIEKKKNGNKNLKVMFFITGMLTCFFDFLSAELITILVPLTLILSIRYKEKRLGNLKENLKFLISSIILGAIGYFGMWIAKWILASIVLNINALDFVVDKALVRVNGAYEFENISEIYREAIPKNIFSLFPFNLIKDKLLLVYFFVIAVIAFLILKKNKKELKNIVPFLIILILPYIRYIVLANHSYRHYFFTFREQFSTIICIILIFIYGIDKNKFKKEIKLKKKDRKNV